MKKLILLLMFSGIGFVYAQRDIDFSQTDGFIEVQRRKQQLGYTSLTYDKIDGSPYMIENFSKGTVYLKNGQSKKYNMRFDMYTGEFELKMKEGLFNLRKDGEIDKVEYMNNIFRLIKSKDRKGDVESEFMIELANGKYSLYKKKYVAFEEEEEAKTGYDEYKPPRFEGRRDKYFIQTDKKLAKEITTFRKRAFLKNYIKEDSKKHLRWIKDYNINLRDEEELIRFLKYLNGEV